MSHAVHGAIGAVLLLLCLSAAGGEPASQPAARANRLIHEKSPYLLEHAHNPVDWYPWGDEAFAAARRENKPIFLSVGYSTCHWCHVMERESFSDPAVAKLINDYCIAIKVDREERPDVDRIYMDFVERSTGGGGWPMTVFLTPDRKPFFAGTYFPPEDADGSPGLKKVLTRIHEVWTGDHERVVKFSDSVARQMAAAVEPPPGKPARLEAAALEAAARKLASQYDREFGGFGQSTKFPMPVYLRFLLRESARAGDASLRDMALHTLDAMAAGGIHDQLGGGFHRYATDRRWFLPHFEKMLYDQAQLATVYLEAYQVTHEQRSADVARDTLDYVLRDMTGPLGQFYSAEDADSAASADEPDRLAEGAFYTWKASQIEEIVGKDAAPVFNAYYGVEAAGNVQNDPRGELAGKNVLSVDDSGWRVLALHLPADQVNATLRDAKTKVLAARNRRPRPRRDDKALAAWNGLMISALSRAAVVLGDERYALAAGKAADFAAQKLVDPASGRLSRSYLGGPGVGAFLQDYALLMQGLLDLYETTGDAHRLQLALQLQQMQDRLFRDDKSGGYFTTAGDDPSLLLRQRDESDNVEPAGSSVACLNLLRLSRMLDDAALAAQAQVLLDASADHARNFPMDSTALLAALDFRLGKPRQILLAVPPGGDAGPMLREVFQRFAPNQIVLHADGGEGQAFLAKHVAMLNDVKPIDGKPTAYVCDNFACQLPTNDMGQLRKLLVGGK